MTEETKSKSASGKMRDAILISVVILSILINVGVFLYFFRDKAENVNITLLFDKKQGQNENSVSQMVSTHTIYDTVYVNNALANIPSQSTVLAMSNVPTNLTINSEKTVSDPSQIYMVPDSAFSYRDSVSYSEAQPIVIYYVIAGISCDPETVQQTFQSFLKKGYKTELLFCKSNLNCKRISVGKFRSRQKAEQLLASVKKSGIQDAWLLAQRY